MVPGLRPGDRLAGVVLVGGSSRRMGRDKATMPCPAASGLPMVEPVVGVLRPRCDPVFVLAAPSQRLPVLAAEVIVDESPGSGPLAAAAGGLRAAAACGIDRAFVAAGDMPYLTVELVDQLTEICQSEPETDIALPFDGRDHYLAGVYRTALADRIDVLVATGRRSMASLGEAVVTGRLGKGAGGRALANINSPGDLPGGIGGG